MHWITKFLKKMAHKLSTTFEPSGFTLWGIHVTEVLETMVSHPEKWTALHMAVTFAVLAKAINWLKS